METIDGKLTILISQSKSPREEYRQPDNVKGVDLKKEPKLRYFELSKIRTYDCELKVE